MPNSTPLRGNSSPNYVSTWPMALHLEVRVNVADATSFVPGSLFSRPGLRP